MVRISGYGQTGPLREQPGFGTIAEAAGGLRYITGEPDGPPTRVGLSLGDSIASMHALVGALIALHERERSGRGQIVDVALTESLITMLESVIPEYGYLGMIRERTGNIAHNSAPTNAYLCADGALVCIAANTTRLFRALFQAIGRDDYADDPDLATNQGRVRRAAELDSVIAAWTRTRTASEVVALLREHQIPVSRINSIADIAVDPQVLAREMIVAVDDDRLDRPLLVPGIAPKLSRTPGRVPASGAPTRRRHRGGPGAVQRYRRRAPSAGPRRRGPARRDRPPSLAAESGWAPSRPSAARSTGPTSGRPSSTSTSSSATSSWRAAVPGLTFDPEEATERAVRELTALHAAGIGTVVDLTVPGLGRAIPLVAAVAARVPLHLVAATGYYTADVLPLYFQFHGPGRLIDEPDPLVAMFVRDIEEGIAGTSVRAGMIKVMTGPAGGPRTSNG